MWLQLSQVLKKFTEGNGRKPAFIFYADVTKIQKTRVVQALRASLLHLRMRTVAENLRLCFEVQVNPNRYFRNIWPFMQRKA